MPSLPSGIARHCPESNHAQSPDPSKEFAASRRAQALDAGGLEHAESFAPRVDRLLADAVLLGPPRRSAWHPPRGACRCWGSLKTRETSSGRCSPVTRHSCLRGFTVRALAIPCLPGPSGPATCLGTPSGRAPTPRSSVHRRQPLRYPRPRLIRLLRATLSHNGPADPSARNHRPLPHVGETPRRVRMRPGPLLSHRGHGTPAQGRSSLLRATLGRTARR
jgi:hypothetical protein